MMYYDLSGKKVLVTGATGFIGRHVIQRLCREKTYLRALIRNPAKARFLEQLGVEIIQGDITDAASIDHAVQGCQVILHFAGMLNDFCPWDRYYHVNVEATHILANAAIEAGVERFIHTSTVWSYGIEAGPNTNERAPLRRSGDAYADTKLEAELLIRWLCTERHLPGIIVQPAEVYGPYDLTWTMRPIQMIRAGRMFLANGGTGVIQPIYIDDLVEGILAAVCRGTSGQAYILCGNDVISIRDYFGHLGHLVGKDRLPTIPGWLAFSVATLAERLAALLHTQPIFTRREVRATTQHATFDGHKAQQELGFTPQVSLAEGMNQIKQWLQSQ